ncbi:MAG: IS66 family insertion sequence element accessory protein TnpB [Rhodoferax sp.]|uniref:IS66 family insertion sequence element accessory protein TnpB n=1 Tax=Rhodoferax sp. TaxID=50421 RepID=UPI0013FF505D|nr:IS66 family insertion sequence element accessory protein TnpB [Rhodoferax sp.]NDP40931.1 IS66 family insertion sequence element accessory protein TnpB [Rhodoferax sp.]
MHPGCSIDQVYLCREPIDFRKAINGLSALVEQELGLSPFASALYVFTNRRHTQLKALYWHRNGFCLWQKRLEADKFAWPVDGMQKRPLRAAVCMNLAGSWKALI